MSMVFWHFDKYMLAVWSDDFEAAAVPEALRHLTLVLSENFKSKLGVDIHISVSRILVWS